MKAVKPKRSDLNDELTIINSAEMALDLLEPSHPAHRLLADRLLADIQGASARCIGKSHTVKAPKPAAAGFATEGAHL